MILDFTYYFIRKHELVLILYNLYKITYYSNSGKYLIKTHKYNILKFIEY